MSMKLSINLLALSLVVSCAAPPPQSYVRPVGKTAPAGERANNPGAPRLKKLKNGHYRVRRQWVVRLEGRRWVVQKGYSSNGITAPDKLKKTLGDGVKHPETWAAVFHDWLFTQPGISRSEADRLFHELLIAYGVDSGKARLMYSTVSAYSLSKQFN